MGVFVCIAYTHTAHEIPGCEPRGRDKTHGKPKDSRFTQFRHMCICICVQRTHVYVYARRPDEILD